MIKYASHLLIGLILVVIADIAIGKALEYFYFNNESGLLHRTTYSIEETEADVLVFGSSRANHHYDTKLIEEQTNLSAYNTGRDGNFIFYQTAVLKSVLKRYTPKQIVLDFTGTFAFNQSDYDRLSSLLPYYRGHEEMRDVILLKSKFERFKLWSDIYPYNSLLTTIAVGNLEFNKRRENNVGAYNGYVPMHGTMQGSIETVKTDTMYDIDDNKARVFEEFLLLTKEHKVPLLVVYSPVNYTYASDYSIELCGRICAKHQIPFIDFSRSDDFVSKGDLFHDESHLNAAGAELFTEKIIQLIEDSVIDNR
ncbi:hypothetical protein [Neolewinella antarctica]|uniref:SGNH/GDSL hydrolase family protein n=1 Tax=Neolewinella antarctica TaxID=442734 RepID=A0ABX0X7S0_9BACT|nr:hypothetical protein [Neolewinella antarctica]NJC24918.1 hypothetical protein [Neolewinella antarctica]